MNNANLLINKSSKIMFKKITLILSLALFTIAKAQTTRSVNSQSSFDTALSISASNDIIEWEDGTYSDIFMDITVASITVKAQTAGGVIFNGASRVEINADHVTFTGFQYVSGDIATSNVAEIDANNVLFEDINISEYTSYKYLIIQTDSQYATVKNCNFEHRVNNPDQNIMSILVSANQPGYHKVQYCSFKNFDGEPDPTTGSIGDAGVEPIRIGVSTTAGYASKSIIEYCYFTNCNGDGEIISHKAQECVYRYNTFDNNLNSELVLRHGNSGIVYGNFFINGMGGVRIQEASDHVIFNNYFSNLSSSSIYLRNDDSDPVENVTIAYNTITNSRGIRLTGGSDIQVPTNVTLANNTLSSINSSSNLLEGATDTETWFGNIYDGNINITVPTTGLTNTNPLLSLNSEGFYEISATSPVIDNAEAGYTALPTFTGLTYDNDILLDILSNSRPTTETLKDVGCQEYNATSTLTPYVTSENTGPSYSTSDTNSDNNNDVSETYDNITTASGYYINKLIVSPGGSDQTNEYIEVRGPANEIIPSNLYLVAIEGDGSSSVISRVEDAIQLGDGTRTFGANGLLAIISNYTQDSGGDTGLDNLDGYYPSAYNGIIASDATVIEIAVTGTDLASGSSSTFTSASPDIGYDGNFLDPGATYMLITADANPHKKYIDILDNSDGVTATNDGIIDTTGDHVDDNWILYDSVSYLDDDDFATSEYGYAQTVFAKRYSTDGTGTGTAEDNSASFKITTGANIINHDSTNEIAYIFRQGLKTGITTNDWVAAANGSGSNPFWQLTGTSTKLNRPYFKGFIFQTDIFYGEINPVEPTAWLGITSDWDTASNWELGVVPTEGDHVSIGTGTSNIPTISETTGASVSTLDVTGSLIINSGGSLIVSESSTGNITYNRNLPTTNWYLVSIPFEGELIQDVVANHTLATGTGDNIGLSSFDNDNAWNYYTNASQGSLINGQGYAIKLAAAGNFNVSGTLNTSDVIHPINTGTAYGYNLIGNPFTSYINLNTFFTDNSAALSESTIWMWDGSQYVTFNMINSIEIAPTQGFFVLDNANATEDITFSATNQSHQTDTFMKQTPTSNFELFVESDNIKKSTKLFYLANKTTGFDNGYDSSLFGADTSELSIFTELLTDNTGKKLAIQALPNTDINTMIIPVGLVAEAGKEVTFSANSQNLPNDLDIYLEDKINNTFINLSEGDYTITLNNAISGTGKFYIHTSAKSLSTDNISTPTNNISIYESAKGELTITGLQGTGNVKIFSILGKRIINKDITSDGSSTLELPIINAGVYLVHVNSNNKTKIQKVILK